jgi:hypothetical protein
VESEDTKEVRKNRLIREKSPYLLQHASNPVDWYPWSEEAFQRAREEDRPIFLSIGYATCHWCHVMAHESFEDPEVARLLNESFVCIKLDREERPDIDDVYMAACQMMTGHGGWPLTIVMTPDGKPFFAGTYFPRKSRFGHPGMLDLVPRLSELWRTRRDDMLKAAGLVSTSLEGSGESGPGVEPSEAMLHLGYEQLTTSFDEVFGGFGPAPKFPSPHTLLFLLRYWRRTGKTHALTMVERTLESMRRGGVYDQLGFGFHRYSTDARWLVPHFEKMLYDQALLAMAYLECAQATGDDTYARTAREVFTYVLHELISPEGGFHAAEDADSADGEGAFYIWTVDDVQKIVGDEVDLAMETFGMEKKGNVPSSAGLPPGANVLHFPRTMDEMAIDLETPEEELLTRIGSLRERLLTARGFRTRPSQDDAVLADWNGLMVAALAMGARVLGERSYAQAAARGASFVLERMRNEDGRLLHRWRDGEAAVPAFLDDHAFMVWGLIELHQTTLEPRWLWAALGLNGLMLDHFWDDEGGALFTTPDDGEELLVRRRNVTDGAIPSGNAVALSNLFRLARITGDPEMEERATKLARALGEPAERAPTAHTYLLCALDMVLGPSCEVVVAGDRDGDDTGALLRTIRERYLPSTVVLLREPNDDVVVDLAPFTKDMRPIDGKATAYVCQGTACERPVTDAGSLHELLDAQSRRRPR